MIDELNLILEKISLLSENHSKTQAKFEESESPFYQAMKMQSELSEELTALRDEVSRMVLSLQANVSGAESAKE